MSAARATVQVDDGRVRVTRYDLGPGDTIARHRHEHDYLVVPLVDGEIEVVTDDATTPQRLAAGESYQRGAGVEHELVNGAQPYSFVEIEFLPPPIPRR
jgi:beta-alanine degradation protein BauB